MKKEILNLGKDSIIYGVGSVITRFMGLITLPLFTAYLAPEEYGVLAMLALLLMVAHPVFSLGLSAAMGPSYFEKDDPSNKSKVVWSVFAINSVSASILLLLAWSFPILFGQLVRLPPEYSFLVSLTLTGAALTILVTSFMQRVQFEKQAKLYVVITVATALTAILVSVYTVVFLDWGVTGMVCGQAAGNLITFLAFLTVGLKNTSPSISLAMIKELLRLGLPLVPSFAFLFVLMHANKYILEWHDGLDAVGIYSIGFNIGIVMSVFVGGITAAWYPFYMSYMDRQNEAPEIFGRIMSYYVIGAGLLLMLFFAFAKPVIFILVDQEFQSAYVVIGLVACASYFIGIYSILLPGIYFNRELHVQSLLQFFAVIFSLPICYILIKSYGLLGAGFSVLVGHLFLVFFIIAWNFIRRREYIKIEYEKKRLICFLMLLVLSSGMLLAFDASTLSSQIMFSFSILTVCIFVTIQILNEREIHAIPYLKYFKI